MTTAPSNPMRAPLLARHAQWLSLLPLPADNHTALWQWIRMQFNHHSNHFEGNTLTYNETQLLLIHGRTRGDHLLREYEEMQAHDVAFEHIRRLAADARPLSATDLRDLNRICLKEPFYQFAQTPDGQPTRKKILPGQYKQQPNHVLTATGHLFQFAPPEATPRLVAELVEWLQQWLTTSHAQQHQTLLAVLAELHQRFIRIHPFDDGNGRVVRLLMNYLLLRLDFLPMVLNDRAEYIKAIQFADSDFAPLERLFANALIAILQKGIEAKTRRIELNEAL